MAKFEVSVGSEFLGAIDKLEREMPELCEDVLTAGAEVVENQVRANLTGVIGKNLIALARSTGTLIRELGTSPAKTDRQGHYNVRVGFAEPRRGSNVPNSLIGNVLEYGKKHERQPAKPYVTPAVGRVENQAREAMQAKLDEYVRSL